MINETTAVEVLFKVIEAKNKKKDELLLTVYQGLMSISINLIKAEVNDEGGQHSLYLQDVYVKFDELLCLLEKHYDK